MLGLRFNLTPAQTELLLILANRVLRDHDGIILPDWDSQHYVGTMNRLIAKGLATHDRKRKPTYEATEQGIAMAQLVEKHCEHLLSFRKRNNTTRKTGKQTVKK